MSPIAIGPGQLLLCLIFVVIAGAASLALGLRLERDLLWGSVRTFAQLFLVGYVLDAVFAIDRPLLVLAVFVFMVFWAAHAVRGRVRDPQIAVFAPTFLSMVISYLAVTVLVTAAIIQADPWWSPQYFIPLGGMIAGNSMNAISICLERLLTGLRERREEIEQALSLGATYREATAALLADAVRAGMIPSINALMTVGLVSLPGMMTGQILAGVSPVSAVKYQIVVMLMLVASTAIGAVVVASVVRRRCFTHANQLIVQ
ncbi:MAG TPA: iron export ABC transporter permease subunit FetB [Candidatus Latescibacteria bacterium]|jgi:putative ABC transport system permease protein|nr:iron export ABC transporter permease subunit FetB [Gemmatimonadaceae bacterium]MDP6016554.1 iron export ABC transporter permease subunit FetB [Candidatus Latescibacterota bacterium]HJP30879.1 iron export ABC transporter permease subunit FetB [Candidatus Latescibacterota bacterium]